MKKVLSFVLVLSMILGSFGMAFAAPASDVVDTKYEDAVNMLTELDVISGYEDKTFKPEKEVTRAEMATFIIKALNLDEYATAGSTFEDMKGHWADGFVGYAASLKIVAGRTETTFDPNAKVTYDEAITMIVQALGYQGKYMVGGFPGAFVNKAKALGLLDGVVAGKANAVRGDIALLIFNALDNNFVQYDVDGKEATIEPYDNMMKRLAGAYNTKFDVIKGTEGELVNVKEYQGAYAEFYWNADDAEIVAVKEVKSVFLTGDFDASTREFKTEDTTYDVIAFGYDDLNTKNVTEELTPAAFVNGKTSGYAIDTDAEDVVIAAKVSGKKIVEIYSVSVWDGDTFEVTSAMVKAIEKKNQLSSSFKFPEDDNYEVDYTEFVLKGVKDVTEIEKEDVVTAYTDANNFITKLEVSKEVVTGKVSKVNNGATKITVAGKVYEMATEGDTFSVKAGDEVELTLTYAGDVFACEKVAGEADEYAIVVKAQKSDSTNTIDGVDAKIKLFLADGKEVVFAVDEDEITNFATLVDNETLTVGAVIKYDLDKDNKVVSVAAVTAGAVESNEEVSKKGYFGANDYAIAEDALIFVTTTVGAVSSGDAIVAELDADADYAVTTKANLLDSTIGKAAYIVDADTDEIVFMVIDGTSTSDDVYGVVTDKYAVDTEAGYEYVVMMNGEEKKFEGDSKTKYDAMVVGTAGALRVFKFDANGYLDSAAEATSEAAVVVAKDASDTVKVENGRVKYQSSVNRVIADDVVVYVFDAEESVWTLGDVADFNDVDEITVVLYQTDADVNEIDYVVVY